MARLPRFDAPGHPQHVIQRGNDRMRIFREEPDFRFFATALRRALKVHQCALHSYALMTNHVHLLISPEASGAIGRVMQSVGRRYVEYFNRRHRRTGALFEGRYRATLIDSHRYLFACARYIEQNPVRAGMVSSAGEYRWSSYRANALGEVDDLVWPHAQFLALGATPQERTHAYRAMTDAWIDQRVVDEIRSATHRGWALGDDEFICRVERTGRRAAPIRPIREPQKADPKGV